MNYHEVYNYENFRRKAANLLLVINSCSSLEVARERLCQKILQIYNDVSNEGTNSWSHKLLRSRDCMQAFIGILQRRSDNLTGFSVAQAFLDISANRKRPDLQPGFFAEMLNWIEGLEGQSSFEYFSNAGLENSLSGRLAATKRSDYLDQIWDKMELYMSRFADGLSKESVSRRAKNKTRILKKLNGKTQNWNDWQWQIQHIITDADVLSEIITLSEEEKTMISRVSDGRLPFAVTPYYLSLLDDGEDRSRDRCLRSQIIPPKDYVDFMLQHRDNRKTACDFMLESDTSPIDLIVRRYPGIVILKPCNTCPQICVYCQRNWEIEQAMSPNAIAGKELLYAAVEWIRQHPGIHEVLVTGGDPLIMSDDHLEEIFTLLSSIPHVNMIRIGTRTPVTLPMRITNKFAKMLTRFRKIGQREIAVVTHIEHVYEITLDMAMAINTLRRAGISVYNQQVYTFYVSRRFETAYLRLLLRRIGVDPYYTFAPKGKEEIMSYRVPLARIFQEQKEEARLIPGLSRTDEAVFNIPGLGKNYLRARQHRDLLTVLPNGSRVYEFHPWEKNIRQCATYLTTDIPILDYLQRLEAIGENAEDYSSIWFYT
jgi:lysine 2,3-aminomutase